jgi:hypothetical protein
MADENSTPPPAPKADRQVIWLAVFGMLSLLLLALAALGMAFLTGKNAQTPQPSISVVNASNNAPSTGSGPAAPEKETPKGRPERPPQPEAGRQNDAQRSPAQALPGSPLERGGAGKGKREPAAQAIRADTQSPPYYATLSNSTRVQIRARGLPAGPGKLSGPVPFRVADWSSVYASVPGADTASYSYLPDVTYQSSSGKGQRLALAVSNPRKTSAVNQLRAPKGFQFLVAEIRIENLGSTNMAVEPDMFEVQDSEQVIYLPNPELLSANFPASGLAPSGSAGFTAAFLVPADASLSALLAHEPGDGLIRSPLNPR